MGDNNTSPISELEREFINEQKGEGSLSVYIGIDGEDSYAGYDIHPEDIEALYFEGIGVPRWESIEADDIEKKTAIYWEQFNARMDRYPLIGRMRDTDERVEYTPEEIPQLLSECGGVTAGTSDEKAIRTLQKLSLAARKAVEARIGINLKPSQLPNL